MSFFEKILLIVRRNKTRLLWIGILSMVSFFVWIIASYAISPYDRSVEAEETFYTPTQVKKTTTARATVISVNGQDGKVRIDEGRRMDTVVEVKFHNLTPRVGDKVLAYIERGGGIDRSVVHYWRVPGLILLGLLFVITIYIVAGRQGLMSIFGLLISVGVIAFGLIPAIIEGVNAFWASVVCAFVIASVSVFVAHGVRWRTFVSLVSILFILSFAITLAILGGWLGYLTGIYDETSSMIHISNASIDIRGVLVGGIIIATLGVLDDIVTAQTAAIDELYKAQPSLTFKKLFSHGKSVGREHVVSLVNTLALAYVGVSLPMILAIVINFDNSRSLWLLLNSEFIAQELVRTLVSSMALVVAIPISTAIAAWAILHKKKIFATLKGRGKKSGGHNAAN